MLKFLALAATSLLFTASSAYAQTTNVFTYVSSSGSDTNDCWTAASACRTFARAHTQLTDGGMISCLGGGFFGSTGAVTITKSVIIDCKLGSGGNDARAFLINAPGKTVRIRNITIAGNYIGVPAIDIVAAVNVSLDNVFISDTGPGRIQGVINRTNARLNISNSVLETFGGVGIVVAPPSGTVSFAVLEKVQVRSAFYGIAVASGGRVAIRNSVFAANELAGIEADPGAEIDFIHSISSGNQYGAQVAGIIRIQNSQFDYNTTAFAGTAVSLGGNRMTSNNSTGTTPVLVSGAPADIYN